MKFTDIFEAIEIAISHGYNEGTVIDSLGGAGHSTLSHPSNWYLKNDNEVLRSNENSLIMKYEGGKLLFAKIIQYSDYEVY